MAEELEETILDEEEGGEGEGKKGFPLKLVIILVAALVVVGGGGFFAYKMFFSAPEEPAVTETAGEEQQGAEAPKEGTADEAGVTVYPLDPFIVNLADPAGNRYLKVKMALDLESKELASEVERKIPLLRDSILLLLSSKSFGEISTIEGKLKLRSELIHRINQVLTSGRVSTLYFTEFVVQ